MPSESGFEVCQRVYVFMLGCGVKCSKLLKTIMYKKTSYLSSGVLYCCVSNPPNTTPNIISLYNNSKKLYALFWFVFTPHIIHLNKSFKNVTKVVRDCTQHKSHIASLNIVSVFK